MSPNVGHSRGNVIVKVLPLPFSDCTLIRP